MLAVISIVSSSAEECATKIGQANDRLTISQTVDFSSETTIPGNSVSQASFEILKKSAPTVQQLLNRDVSNIHSAVEAFERTDQITADLIKNITIR